jgi:prepilin-type N-terminal cleavage/methylation domain-containing protein
MTNLLKRLIKRQPGFTLVETLIVVAIIGAIITGATTSIFQLIKISQADKNTITAIRILDIAGNWLARDFEPAASIPSNITLIPGHNALTITQSVLDPEDTEVSYSINNNKELIRTIEGTSTVIGSNITQVEFTSGLPASVNISALAGQKTLSRSYEVASQLNALIDLQIQNKSLSGGDRTIPYTQTLKGIGGTEPYSWSISSGNLPGWATLNASTGVISGTPNSTGTTSFTVMLNDSAGKTATKDFSIIISELPSITTSSLPDGEMGIIYNQPLVVTNGTGPYRWSLLSGSLPDGLDPDLPGGVITGTPVTSGIYSFTVQVQDFTETTATKDLSIKITGPLVITTTTPLSVGYVNVAYSQTLEAGGGSETGYTWSISSGSLPAWATLSSSTGVITGTPNTSSTTTFTAMVTDSAGHSATKLLDLTVTPQPITITTTSPLPNGYIGEAYNLVLSAVGGSGTGFTWSLQGTSTLPAGLTLSSTGITSGTPTTIALSNVTFKVTDSTGNSTQKDLSITIAYPALLKNEYTISDKIASSPTEVNFDSLYQKIIITAHPQNKNYESTITCTIHNNSNNTIKTQGVVASITPINDNNHVYVNSFGGALNGNTLINPGSDSQCTIVLKGGKDAAAEPQYVIIISFQLIN